jgi:ribonuclease P protein component
VRLTLGDDRRVKSSRDFDAVFALRKSAADAAVLVFVHPRSEGLPRLGVSVGKKFGNAPARNRIKRVLREGFRLAQPALPPGFDLVLVPRDPAKLNVADLQKGLPALARQAIRRYERSRAEGTS